MKLHKTFDTLFVLFMLAFSVSIMAGNPLSMKLTDPVIVKELMNTNEGEIEIAQMALKKAAHMEVKKYAEEIIKDHSDNNKQTMNLAKELKIEPSSTVKTEATTLWAEKDFALLKLKKGKEFDQAYIENEIKVHLKLLGSLKNEMIPNTKSQELKKLLEQTTERIKSHLVHAQRIQTELI
jgi:putative membrane protein